MAGDAFQKFKSSVNRGITTISVKTSSSLEKTKIKTHIDSINREIQKNFLYVGENAYNVWTNGSDDFSVLNEKFEEIKSKYKEIDELKEQLVYIDQRDSEILGTTAKNNQTAQQVSAEETVAVEEAAELETTDAEEPKAEQKEEQKVETKEEPKVEEVKEEPQEEEAKAEQPKKRYCRNCGTAYEGTVKFCRNCGTQMNP